MKGQLDVRDPCRGILSEFGRVGAIAPVLGALLVLGACGAPAPTERPPVQFTEAAVPRQSDKFVNWPLPPSVIETDVIRALQNSNFEIVASEKTATGITGAEQVTVFFPEVDKKIKFKWKTAQSNTLDQDNNSPRREIAVYQIQKLFLDSQDYVVPTSLMLCVPADTSKGEKPNVPGAKCVLGNIAIWLREVTQPDDLYDQERFLVDPIYAYYMANFNLLTFLVSHKDGKASNFLLSKEEDRPHLFAIDNGTSFRSAIANPFATNWNVIRIPAFRKESIDRLRGIKREDLDVFGVVAQLEMNEEGILKSVPPGPNLDPIRGVRIVDGTVQLGLSENEIGDLWERIQEVIAEVDSGELPVF